MSRGARVEGAGLDLHLVGLKFLVVPSAAGGRRCPPEQEGTKGLAGAFGHRTWGDMRS